MYATLARSAGRSALWPLLVLCLALGSCTGTFETRPATLLVVTLVQEGNPSEPQVALVVDTFLTTPTPTTDPRLAFLESSRRALPAPAVALDVVDRGASRSEVVILTRERSAPHAATLNFFNLAGIDPDDPIAFAESRPAVDLLAFLGDPDACPVNVQIDSEGRYAAILDKRRDCSGEDFLALYLIDLEEGTVLETVDTEPLLEPIFIDQRESLLYYLREQVGTAALIGLRIPGTARVFPDPPSLPGTDQVAIAQLGERLLVLRPNRFAVIPLDPPADVDEEIATVSGAKTILADVVGTTTEVVILSESQLAVHPSAAEEAETTSLRAVDGVLEPLDQFAYLLQDGAITVFDLLTFDAADANPFSSKLGRFSLPELTQATHLTWARAAIGDQAP